MQDCPEHTAQTPFECPDVQQTCGANANICWPHASMAGSQAAIMSQPVPSSTNPRRIPAHLSVTLRHRNPVESNSNSGGARPEQGIHIKARGGIQPARQTTDDSDNSGDSAEKWFHRSNNHPTTTEDQGFEDNEPPFFQPQDSSGSSNHALGPRGSNLLPRHIRTSTLASATNGSVSDDYRSVIDDLTIENRNLKDKLRKLEGSYSILENDKLFELKIHGLSPHKKTELEEMLRGFVSSIYDSNSTYSTTKTSPDDVPLKPYPTDLDFSGSGAKNNSNSSTSNSRPINSDSAYASHSNGGAASGSMNRANGGQGQLGKELNVETFLHNMDKTLLPKHQSIMTEKQKKKEVVRRLEQLFTGKTDSIIGDHSQPLQQQEVSDSAARADQASNRGPALAEGIREAHIRQDIDLDKTGSAETLQHFNDGRSSSRTSRDQYDSAPYTTGGSVSPEQRPTRPLDLDPDRQQIPSDNVQYIRHLGLSTPQLLTENSYDVEPDADGWIYLNLLISMAQLHIINVTPDFVRSAVSEVSEKFQLSKDGRKIRWRGGTEGTRLSSGSSESEDSPHSRSSLKNDTIDAHSGKKRKTNSGMGHEVMKDRLSTNPIRAHPVNVQTQAARAKSFHYKPLGLFKHRSSSQEDLMSLDETPSYYETNNSGGGGISGGYTSGHLLGAGFSRRRCDHGPQIFYSGPFYVDLSADIRTPVNPQENTNRTQNFLGRDSVPDETLSFTTLPLSYGRKASQDGLEQMNMCPKTPDLLKSENPKEMEFSPSWASSDSDESHPLQKFSASGLGGTQPADHFLVKVRTRRTKLNNSSRAELATFSSVRSRRILHRIRKSSIDFFKETPAHTSTITSQFPDLRSASPSIHRTLPAELPVRSEVISTTDPAHLPPSDLPAPLYFGATTSSEDDSDCSSSQSSSGVSHLRNVQPYLPTSFTSTCDHIPRTKVTSDESMGDVEDESEDDEVDADDSDSSIDMLAHARELAPATIAAREQEFERNVATRVLEHLPAGSSAATIHGGSGFSSDAAVASSGDD